MLEHNLKWALSRHKQDHLFAFIVSLACLLKSHQQRCNLTEASVQGIAATWASLGLDMAEYKATYKLRSTEEVFAALEDNMVTLSTMKASRFFAVFEKDVTLWEKTLSLVSETIELVLTVRHHLLLIDNHQHQRSCQPTSLCQSPVSPYFLMKQFPPTCQKTCGLCMTALQQWLA